MTWYLCTTTTKILSPAPGAEKVRGDFAVAAQLQAAGIEAMAPRRIDFVRRGKKRNAEPVISAWLPGYVFANIPAHRFAEVITTTKGMSRSVMAIHPSEMEGTKERPGVRDFCQMADAKLAEAERIISRQDRFEMAQFNQGDLIEIIGGPFFERAAQFVRMVRAAGDDFDMIEAEVEMFGSKVRARLDPLDVRAR